MIGAIDAVHFQCGPGSAVVTVVSTNMESGNLESGFGPIVSDVAAVAFATNALEKSIEFYNGPFGLQLSSEPGASSALLRGTGGHPVVLELVAAEHPSLLCIYLVAHSNAAVDEAADRLARAGVELESGPGALDGPLGGYGLRVHDPAGVMVDLRAGIESGAALEDDSAVPIRIAHVGINCTDVNATTAFYTDHLGFTVTDEYEGRQTVFLACGVDHHRLVIVEAGLSGIQHVAFEMDGVDGVMTGWGRMRAAGHDTIWGPGRHGPGGNSFCYFEDPTGIVVEYSSAPFQLEGDTWESSVWERKPSNANVWGTGGPSPRAIALMTKGPESS